MRNDEHFPSRTPLLKEAALAPTPPCPLLTGREMHALNMGNRRMMAFAATLTHSLTLLRSKMHACRGEGVMKALNIGGAVAPKRVVRVKTSKHPSSSFRSNRGSLVNLLLMQQI